MRKNSGPESAMKGISEAPQSSTIGRVSDELIFQFGEYLDVDELDAFELIHLLGQLEHCEIVGDPSHAFSVVDRKTGALHVYARHADSVKTITSEEVIERVALGIAKRLGAIFTASLDIVTCTINGRTSNGTSKGIAALRAIVREGLHKCGEKVLA